MAVCVGGSVGVLMRFLWGHVGMGVCLGVLVGG